MSRAQLADDQELREACEKALGNKFKDFFASDPNITTVEDPIEYTFFQYVDAFKWGVNISGIDKEHRLSDLKASMVTNTFVNPPGFSHQAAGRARLCV